MKNSFSHIGHGLLGFAEGALVSVTPCPINALFCLLFLVLWPLSLVKSKSRLERYGHRVKIGVAVLTIVTAWVLPVKELDKKVGPMHYDNVTLDELCTKLDADWGINVFNIPDYNLIPADPLVSFTTDIRMSRLQVLEKLAEATDRELRIWRCALGATFLFGAHYSAHLRPKDQKNHNQGQPADSPDSLQRDKQ